MAKNLIDDISLEFYEGMEREEHVSKVIEGGQTVEIIPFSIATDRTIGQSSAEDDKIWLVDLDYPIYTEEYNHIIFDITIIGLKMPGDTSASSAIFTPRIQGEDIFGNSMFKSLSTVKAVNDVEGNYFPSRCEVDFVIESTGQYHRYLIGYQNGSFTTANSKNTSEDEMPYKITKVGLYLDNLNSFPVQTNGIIATIKGVKTI